MAADVAVGLRDRVLRFFPAFTHPLTLVSDPDGLLADEATLGVLGERGFGVVGPEPDPIDLRHRVEAARPFTPDRPLLIVTGGPVNRLPYDLWWQGYRVELALHAFFPNLDYSVVRALGPLGRVRLGRADSRATFLGERATVGHVLRHAFDADPEVLRQPAAFVAWLADYHLLGETMPQVVASELLAALRPLPAFAGWELDTLLKDPAAFARFVGEQWRGYVGGQMGRQLSEAPVPYLLGFGEDVALQDDLPRLLRTGVLVPIEVTEPDRLPGWTRPGVMGPNQDRRPRRIDELGALLDGHVASSLAEARWPVWQAAARAWAELNVLRDAPDLRIESGQEAAYRRIRAALDEAFVEWLRRRYAVLAGQRVPTPHHVFHVPEYVAYQRRQGSADRVAVIVLDGLAVRDWWVIGEAWRARHSDWRLVETLLLAQVPTITAVSRQALIGGLRPADFAATIEHNRAEAALWCAFWAREGVAADACSYGRLRRDGNGTDEVVGSRVRVACLVETSIDDIVHGASLGAADVQASLRLWLERVSPRLEGVVGDLVGRGFTVYLGSDHGHVEARGIGQPAEGVIVQTRGRRARTYRDHRAAANVRERCPETELWGGDGVLPDDLWAVMPLGREAFAPVDDVVVTHGGLTVDEVVVPFVTIGRA